MYDALKLYLASPFTTCIFGEIVDLFNLNTTVPVASLSSFNTISPHDKYLILGFFRASFGSKSFSFGFNLSVDLADCDSYFESPEYINDSSYVGF